MTGRGLAGSDRRAAAQSWRRALEMTAPIAQHPMATLPVVIDRLADTFGDAPALLSDRQTLSYRGLAQRAEHYARWALDQQLARGEVVCLMMPNCPEYLAIWLGIVRAGGVVALLNTNLVGEALRHAVDIVAPRHVIVAAELADAVAAELPRLPGAQPWAHGGDAQGWPRIDRGQPAGRRAPRLPRADARRPRALHLHLGYHGAAQGGKRQPSPADAMDALVRRADRHDTG